MSEHVKFYDLKGENKELLVQNFAKMLQEKVPEGACDLRLTAAPTMDDAEVIISFERKKKVIVYAFDVDQTLEISEGPIKLNDLMKLRCDGHIVGICGNWGVFVTRCNGWQHLASFLSIECDKPRFLKALKQFIPADDYVMVGNVPGISGVSDDIGAAKMAGWRFIQEIAFANGAR